VGSSPKIRHKHVFWCYFNEENDSSLPIITVEILIWLKRILFRLRRKTLLLCSYLQMVLLHHFWLVFDGTHTHIITQHKYVTWHTYMHDFLMTTVVWHGDNKRQAWMRAETYFFLNQLFSSPHLTTHMHTSTNNAAHTHTWHNHHSSSVWPHPTHMTSEEEGRHFIFSFQVWFLHHPLSACSSHQLTTRFALIHAPHTHTCTSKHMHAGWPAPHPHTKSSHTFIFVSCSTPIYFCSHMLPQTSVIKYFDTHIAAASQMICTTAASSHNVCTASFLTHINFSISFSSPI
jgi:hypothetical protein